MTYIKNISRRSFLYSANAILVLPLMNSLVKAVPATQPDPKRMVFMGVGYGFTIDSFFPTKSGKFSDIGLPEGMAALKRHQDDLTMVGNLTSGLTGDPHSGSTNFLTGANNVGVSDKTFFNSVSCDQIAAEELSKNTRYKSLRVTPATLSENNGHGRGLSLSWDKAGNPLPGLEGPLAFYRALFANKDEKTAETRYRLEQKKSILDLMEINSRTVNNQIGKDDQAKLDEYFQAIRQVELAVGQEAAWLDRPKPQASFQFQEAPSGEKEIKLMYDLIALALQTDATRVLTYMMPNKTLLESIGVKFHPHALSHYEIGTGHKEASKIRDRKHAELFAYFLDRLKEKKDSHGLSLFDSTIVSFGSSIRGQHQMKNIPLILAGGGARLKRGESIILPKQDTPLSNLWLTLLQEAGVKTDKFSQSTGTVREILR
jgi:hypothetical protein